MAGGSSRRSQPRASLGALQRAPIPPKTLIDRQRLYQLLDQASELPLTMVVAPAGTGKTVLLSAWVEQIPAKQRERVVFLSAREHAELNDVLGTSANAGDPTVVVIDDAHELGAVALRNLRRLLDERQPSVRLVIASRRDLPFPITELELRGSATMIRAGHLRFNDTEAEALARVHAADISRVDVRALQERTGGWAAALVLGARTYARDLLGGVPASMKPDQPVLDFLLGDAFTALSRPVRHLLLCTFDESVVTADRAAVLSDNPDADALLSELVNDGLLVTAYGRASSGDVVYHYHPLLIELLRRRVVKGGADAAAVAAAHRRASIHDAAHGRDGSALQQAISARDDDLLAGLLVETGPTMLWSGESDVVASALERLPGEALEMYPQLLGVASLHRRSIDDMTGAVALARRARKAAGHLDSPVDAPRSPTDDALIADVLLLDLWQARYGWQDAPSAVAAARRRLGCRHESTSRGGHDHRLDISPERQTSLLVELAGVEIWTGDVASASVHIDDALVSARQVDHPRLLAITLAHRAFLELLAGVVHSAEETADEAMTYARLSKEMDEAVRDRAQIVLAWSAYHRYDVDLARERLSQLDTERVARSDVVLGTSACLLRACLLCEDGALDEARRELAHPPEAPGPLPGFLARCIAIMRWQCAMLAGDNGTAIAQLDALATAGYLVEVDLLRALAGALSGASLDTLPAIERLADELGSTDPLLAAAAMAARVALLIRGSDMPAAREAITDVLSRVAPQGTVVSLTAGAWAEPQFMDLLAEECSRPDAHPFAATALEVLTRRRTARDTFEPQAVVGRGREAAQRSQRRGAAAASGESAVPRPRPAEVSLHGFPVSLTTREADVLEQLALGSSYTEIGKALYITENTVKTHLASLYRKLGVDKRSAALRVARELGLL